MAFVVGDQVLPNNSASFTRGATAQPPSFGVISDISALPDVEILWDNGTLTSAVAAAAVDRLTDPDPGEVTRVDGKVVRVQPAGPATLSAAAAYDAIVVNMYRRDNAGGGAPGATTFALIKSLQNGVFLEIDSALLQPVSQ